MKPNNLRENVIPKDVQRLMNKNYKPARMYLMKIREHYEKQPHQIVSVEEFCLYSGFKPETVRAVMT